MQGCDEIKVFIFFSFKMIFFFFYLENGKMRSDTKHMKIIQKQVW